MNKTYPENITAEDLKSYELSWYRGEIVLVDDLEKFNDVMPILREKRILGFDTETRPSFHKGQFYDVALLQIALPERVFLIRLNTTGITAEMVHFFENKNILKAGVGVRDDIRIMQKLKPFEAGGFIEITTLAKQAGLQVESVKKLSALLLGFRISKSAQTSNWEAPALNEKQLSYAATDAWVCLEIYKKLAGKV